MADIVRTPPAGTPSEPPSSVTLRALLEEMIRRGASDLHITAAERPKLRIDGEMEDSRIDYVLQPNDTMKIAYSVLTENQKKKFDVEPELDFPFGIIGLARFRGNCFKQHGCVAMVVRRIPFISRRSSRRSI
jgi:twitching motility protein PilT